MTNFKILLENQFILILYICLGWYINKKNIINKKNQSEFVSLIINVFMPVMVFNSFKNVTVNVLYNSIYVFTISSFISFLSYILSKYLYTDIEYKKQQVLKYGTIVNNAGFAGLPLVNSVFGEIGMIYGSVFLIPLRISMWTIGISALTNKDNNKNIAKSLLMNPNIIAVILGLVRGLLKIEFSYSLEAFLSEIGSLVSPLSMIVVGTIISNVKNFNFAEEGIVRYLFIRLLAIPIILIGISRIIMINEVIVGTAMILSAMPAATTTALLASEHNSDYVYASKIVFLSTIISLITVPILLLLI